MTHRVIYLSIVQILVACSLYAQAGRRSEETALSDLFKEFRVTSFDTLTENVAVELALNRSMELQSLDTNVQIASYRQSSSGKITNPEFRLSEISTRYWTHEFDELRLGLRWRPPKFGELAEDRQQAEVDVWTRRVRAVRFRQDLAAKVRRNYASVVMYDTLAGLAKRRVEVETERLGIVARMVKLGRRSVVYHTKAKLWHAESKNDYARMLQRQRTARMKLSKRTGVPDNVSLIIAPIPDLMLDLDQLIAVAFENRPEIELVHQRIELAQKQYNLEHNKMIPWPRFIDLSYHQLKYGEDWGEMRVGIILPLFNWNRGNIKATNLAVKRKELEFDAIREEIEYEVRAAYTTYEDFLVDWINFSQDVDHLIIEAHGMIEQAKRHDTLLPDEVLEMELTLLETQEILSEKRRSLVHALIDLCFVLGIEGPEQLQTKEQGP